VGRDDSATGWRVLLAATVIICMGHGALMSFGVFLTPVEASLGSSRSGVSGIASVNWIAAGVGSFVWGVLSDRFGTRVVAAVGGFLLGLGLVLSSQATALWQLYVSFGVLVGFAVGALYAPLTSAVTRWFTENRGLAVGIVSGGIGLGVFTVAPLARALISAFEWRAAMLVLGDLAWLVTIPAALLITDRRSAPLPTAARAPAAPEYTTLAVLRAPQFWAIALTHFACCAAHAGPIYHMVAYATDRSVGVMTAATIFGVSGLASVVGRVGSGIVADRVGIKPTIIAALGFQALVIILYTGASGPAAFYALALAFGLAYGGVMPLYALVTREYFGERVMGAAYGGVFFISCLGMGLGSYAGGAVYDRLGSYVWLFGGSFAIAAMAVVLALSFRAPRAVPGGLGIASPAA